MLVDFTFLILILALLAHHVSVNKLLRLVFLIYKWMELAKLDCWLAERLCQTQHVEVYVPWVLPHRDSSSWLLGPRSLHVGRYPRGTLTQVVLPSHFRNLRFLLVKKKRLEAGIDLRKSLSLRNSKFWIRLAAFLVLIWKLHNLKLYFVPICSSQAMRL